MRSTTSLSLPSKRTARRVLRQLPLRGFIRPRHAASDPRFWTGIALGLGVGGAVRALTRRRSTRVRVPLRGRLDGLGNRLKRSARVSQIEESIVIDVPARVAYDQWTQFEEFPQFMQGVREVKQLDDRRLHWSAEIAGQAREWDSEITEQIPDKRIAWQSLDGPTTGGVVTFHYLTNDSCKLMVQMDYEPEGATDRAGEALGLVHRRIRGDLERFRDFVEQRGEATGSFREPLPK